MNMRESIERFAEQCAYEPGVENAEALQRKNRFLVLGMGGSQLPASMVSMWNERLSLWQHRDYGLPAFSDEDLKEHLVIAMSYSGNTEETISGLEVALEKKLACAVIAVGGRLLELAKEHQVPYVQIPDWGLQPRAATGLLTKALLKLMGQLSGLNEIAALEKTLAVSELSAQGKALAAQCEGSVPIIYASRRNAALAMTWKIKFNETAKIPAFFHALPELNHNEMTSYDVPQSSRSLVQPFRWVLLTDDEDDTRVQRRMAVLEQLFHDRALPVVRVPLVGETRWQRIFSSLLVADWCAVYTAEHYGHEATEVPMVEEFKKLIAT